MLKKTKFKRPGLWHQKQLRDIALSADVQYSKTVLVKILNLNVDEGKSWLHVVLQYKFH